jgi:hypothetical protein
MPDKPVTAHALGVRTEPPGWRCRCTCGFVGRERFVRAEAREDCWRHMFSTYHRSGPNLGPPDLGHKDDKP